MLLQLQLNSFSFSINTQVFQPPAGGLTRHFLHSPSNIPGPLVTLLVQFSSPASLVLKLSGTIRNVVKIVAAEFASFPK